MSNSSTEDFFIIGITGPTGSGKSQVSALLKTEGYETIDADQVARWVTNEDKVALQDLVSQFGSEILTEQATLNRRRLGEIAFSDKEKTQLLNDTILPHIRMAIQNQLEEHRMKGKKFVFLDAPTLFESGIHEICQSVIAVIASSPLRLQRLLRREPDLTAEQISLRMNAQPADDFYLSQSDYVIWNNGELSTLRQEVKQVLHKILENTSETR